MNQDNHLKTHGLPAPGTPHGSTWTRTRIRPLDLVAGETETPDQPGARVLWVSLAHPGSLLGALLDEASFEGAWLEADGHARIRLADSGETRFPAPLFHSPETARAWLASELEARLTSPHGPAGAGMPGHPESLAA